jgi:hypothetical protein
MAQASVQTSFVAKNASQHDSAAQANAIAARLEDLRFSTFTFFLPP